MSGQQTNTSSNLVTIKDKQYTIDNCEYKSKVLSFRLSRVDITDIYYITIPIGGGHENDFDKTISCHSPGWLNKWLYKQIEWNMYNAKPPF